jgi:hypothetical protein
MVQLKNAMEIFKILPRTNCRDCRVPTCLAFAAAIFNGDKRLEECPHLDRAVLGDFYVHRAESRTLEREEQLLLADLSRRVALTDLAAAAERLDATFSGNTLKIRMLGKDFHVDAHGNLTSDCHVHGWVAVPLLDYVISCTGQPVSGNWIPMREIRNGAAWAPLFAQRGEKPLKRLADAHTDLFELMVHIFSARPAPRAFDSDIAVILHPLPRIPVLICYWKPDGDMESSLNVFFDDSVEHNLTIDYLYRICAGMVVMFEKIAITHGT